MKLHLGQQAPLRRRGVLGLLALLLGAQLWAQSAASHPEWPGKGQLFVGTCYQPVDRTPAQIRRDIALMKEAGFKMVRMGNLSWDAFEPTEGQFEFAWFDSILDQMQQAGLKVLLDIGGSPAPIWLHHNHPSVNLVDERGATVHPAAFIVRAVSGTLTPAIYNPTPFFTDVPTTNTFFPHIQKMMELGIADGCATGLFCPTDTVPRWQMAIFTVRARLALYGASFSYNSTPYFADVPTNVEGNGIPFPFIQRSYEENITAGCGTNPLVYCPDELVTRGQMASFIMRALFNETSTLGPTAPMLTGVSPNAMAATVGAQITVTVTGVNTNFQTGDMATVPSGMLAVSNVVVNSATSISATLTPNANVVAGPQALVVTSGGRNLTLPLAIKVGTY